MMQLITMPTGRDVELVDVKCKSVRVAENGLGCGSDLDVRHNPSHLKSSQSFLSTTMK